MSLDLVLSDKNGNEVSSLNWLRNPYGLCDWAMDNYYFHTRQEGRHALDFNKSKQGELYYVCNHWAYKSSSAVNRPLFKRVVDRYAKVILSLERGYIFFDTNAFVQFVQPYFHLFPKRYILGSATSNPKGIEVVGDQLEDVAYLGNRMGFNIEWFSNPVFNIKHGYEETVLDQYKAWMWQLVEFANLLQDKQYKFYCSN